MNASDSFREFWSRIRARDSFALAQLVDSLSPRIREYARKRMRVLHIPVFYDPEDTCQWVLGHFLASVERKDLLFGDAREIVRYVYVMTRNRVIDLSRRHDAESTFHEQRPVPTRVVPEEIPSNSDGPVETAQKREILGIIREWFSDEEWRLLISRYSGKPWDEIGAALGASPDAARMRFERLVARIKEQLASIVHSPKN